MLECVSKTMSNILMRTQSDAGDINRQWHHTLGEIMSLSLEDTWNLNKLLRALSEIIWDIHSRQSFHETKANNREI